MTDKRPIPIRPRSNFFKVFIWRWRTLPPNSYNHCLEHGSKKLSKMMAGDIWHTIKGIFEQLFEIILLIICLPIYFFIVRPVQTIIEFCQQIGKCLWLLYREVFNLFYELIGVFFMLYYKLKGVKND